MIHRAVCLSLSLAVMLVWGWFALPADAATIWGDPADNCIYLSGSNTFIFSSTDNYDEVGSNGGIERDFVYVFQLPDRPAGQQITAATFSSVLQYNHAASGDSVDLYGLPYRASSAVRTSDFYVGANDPHATMIQQGYVGSSSPAVTRLNTSAAGSSALVDYLNAQYDAGAAAGDYVFLRVNRPARINEYSVFAFTAYEQAPYEAQASGPTSLPYFQNLFSPALDITFATVPEPASLALLLIGGTTLAVRRRHTRERR